MAILILTLTVMMLVMLGMAVGAILKNKPLKGSCGGLNAIGLKGDCEICGGDRNKCETSDSKKERVDY